MTFWVCGSFTPVIWDRLIDVQIMLFRKMWRCCLGALLRHDSPCSPHDCTDIPQTHAYGSQAFQASLFATATLISSADSFRPTAVLHAASLLNVVTKLLAVGHCRCHVMLSTVAFTLMTCRLVTVMIHTRLCECCYYFCCYYCRCFWECCVRKPAKLLPAWSSPSVEPIGAIHHSLWLIASATSDLWLPSMECHYLLACDQIILLSDMHMRPCSDCCRISAPRNFVVLLLLFPILIIDQFCTRLICVINNNNNNNNNKTTSYKVHLHG